MIERTAIGVIVALISISSLSHSAERVGKAVKINVTVTGAAGSMAVDGGCMAGTVAWRQGLFAASPG